MLDLSFTKLCLTIPFTDEIYWWTHINPTTSNPSPNRKMKIGGKNSEQLLVGYFRVLVYQVKSFMLELSKQVITHSIKICKASYRLMKAVKVQNVAHYKRKYTPVIHLD